MIKNRKDYEAAKNKLHEIIQSINSPLPRNMSKEEISNYRQKLQDARFKIEDELGEYDSIQCK